WVFDEEPKAPEEAQQSPEQAPPSSDYVPGPEHPPSSDYVPGPEYPEYVAPSNDEVPIEDQHLPADASPIALSPGYVANFDPSKKDTKEDPKEDPADYPGDEGDDDEEDKEEEEASEDEHLAPVDSTTLPAIASPADEVPIEDQPLPADASPTALSPGYVSNFNPSNKDTKEDLEEDPADYPATTEALIVAVAAALPSSSPLPSLLTSLSSLLPQDSSPPLPLPSPLTHTSLTYAEVSLGYKAAMIRSRAASPLPLHAPSLPLLLPSTDHWEDVLEADTGLDVTHATDYSFVDTVDATPGRPLFREFGYRIIDVWDDIVGDIEERAPTTLEELSQKVTDLAATLARDTHEMHARQAWSQTMDCNRAKIPPKRTTTTTTTPMTDAAIKALISQGVADALAEYKEHKSSRNGDDNHKSGSGRRTERAAHECTYSDFLKCQPLNFKGTKGVVGLTQWFEKMESVFHITAPSCAKSNLLHTLKKMMTDKYYLKGEIKKLEIEL
nr:hypothetical protein [Tanacetum cinerariifolium]